MASRNYYTDVNDVLEVLFSSQIDDLLRREEERDDSDAEMEWEMAMEKF